MIHQELLYDILEQSVLSAGTVDLYIIPGSCSCILQVRYSRHYRHKIPTLSKTNNITTCMNQNLLCSSQVIKFPEVIPYNFQTKCFKTLTFEQHSLPSTCIFISFSMSPSAGQLCTKIHTSRSALKTL